MTFFKLNSEYETVTFDTHEIDKNDRNFGFVWIHRWAKGTWPGNTMANIYMVRDARRIYGELLAKGYSKN